MDQRRTSGFARTVCRIHLVRHARTALNVQRRYRGRLDVPLDDIGRAEAVAAAQDVASAGIGAVYTSPLQRARDVAEAIASGANLGAPEDLFALINLDYGAWEGLTREECAERDPEAYRLYCEEPERAVAPGGEALALPPIAWSRVSRRRRAPPGDVDRGGHARGDGASGGASVAGRIKDDWQLKLATGSATVFEVVDGALRFVALPGEGVEEGASALAPAVGL